MTRESISLLLFASILILGCVNQQPVPDDRTQAVVCIDTVSCKITPIFIVNTEIIVDIGVSLINEGNCYVQAVDVEFKLYDKNKDLLHKWDEKVETDFEPDGGIGITRLVYEHRAMYAEATVFGYYW